MEGGWHQEGSEGGLRTGALLPRTQGEPREHVTGRGQSWLRPGGVPGSYDSNFKENENRSHECDSLNTPKCPDQRGLHPCLTALEEWSSASVRDILVSVTSSVRRPLSQASSTITSAPGIIPGPISTIQASERLC